MSPNERRTGLLDECGLQKCAHSRSFLKIGDSFYTQRPSEVCSHGVG